ncbi:MAG: hypothetical protein K0Q51_327 [Rickettsiaceae bacterium]|jgi:hypothetical protein|nr:hypothetical protein [Rickettsiaceae bacterium]
MYKIIIYCIFISCFQTQASAISVSELLPGDIIFWKALDQEDRAGHVAVVTITSKIPQNIRIAHATDNPKYYSFVETYIPPSKKLITQNKYYYVIRIADPSFKQQLLNEIQTLLKRKIPFNSKSEKLMNQWDDSMVGYPAEVKLKLQNVLFQHKKLKLNIPDEAFMCSEVIIVALQKSWLKSKGMDLPKSLQLDPILCPPSTMLFALERDLRNFKNIGELRVEDYKFSFAEKKSYNREKSN